MTGIDQTQMCTLCLQSEATTKTWRLISNVYIYVLLILMSDNETIDHADQKGNSCVLYIQV